MDTIMDQIRARGVKGLCSYNWGGPVTVKDATTGEVIKVIHDAPGFDEVMNTPGAIKGRRSNGRFPKPKRR